MPDILADLLLGIGILFTLAGSVGMLRFPDFYTRLHAAGVTETLGMIAIVAGLMMKTEGSGTLVRLVFIGVFMLITAPIASHALARAARHGGVRPALEEEESSPGT